jgi:hypothetical protein
MFTLADIIISDLVPLSERGLYQGLFHVTWAFASVIGPLIVGPFMFTVKYIDHMLIW